MQIKVETLEPTKFKLTITADQKAIDSLKEHVLGQLSSGVKVAGFRPGKAPANLVEKQIDPNVLQNEFLNEAINHLYSQAVKERQIKVVKEPQVTITKFVPFTELEFTAEVEAVGELKVGNYKTIRLEAKKPVVTPKEVTEVVDSIRQRSATREDAKRPAKNNDEVVIDFKGIDAATKANIDGAEGKEYPLILGSNSFIPGFEEKLIGIKPGGTKTFDLTFPKDYGAANLQNKKVTFTVTVLKVNELISPKLDDEFAKKVGPFKSAEELKADVKKQLIAEKQASLDQELNNELLQKIVDKSDIALPDSLIDDEVNRIEDEERRNVAYRGQTWQEHLDQEKVTAEEHKQKQRPLAEMRIKSGLILGDISDKENITVSDDEFEQYLNIVRAQYANDPSMTLELEKPDNLRDLKSRMMIDKTIKFLRDLATTKAKAAPKK